MQRHRSVCDVWKRSPESHQENEPKIPLRHVHPLVSNIDISQDDLDSETELEPCIDPAKRVSSIEEEVMVLKVMTS